MELAVFYGRSSVLALCMVGLGERIGRFELVCCFPHSRLVFSREVYGIVVMIVVLFDFHKI